ncbi:hypothetical protein AVEN_71849-1 [Araneus ventricosus]|uniref:Uncharacterized protein n=1 Tax=Araneus ventricosus TaxID=182803 RepID=A0A4Y2J8N5_ARAVE|nr:hypothetical protein AVEN_71849-1 [Araneus ventricosus]
MFYRTLCVPTAFILISRVLTSSPRQETYLQNMVIEQIRQDAFLLARAIFLPIPLKTPVVHSGTNLFKDCGFECGVRNHEQIRSFRSDSSVVVSFSDPDLHIRSGVINLSLEKKYSG